MAALRESALGRLFGRAPDYGELFGLLRQAGENIRRSTALLAQLIARWPEENGERHDLVDCEHEGDRITHDIIHHLYRRAATPFDQEDVLALASGLDDVVDYAEEVADFLFLYKVEAPMEQAVALAVVLEQAGAKLAEVLVGSTGWTDSCRTSPRSVAWKTRATASSASVWRPCSREGSTRCS
ncbi:MAG: DUF47 domain-containing protein [Thermoleophilaceae bacterium]